MAPYAIAAEKPAVVTFVIQENGNVTFKNRKIVDFITPTFALVLMTARNNFGPKDHVVFDEYIASSIAKGIKFTYVANFTEFRNPEKRLAEFVGAAEDAISLNKNFGFGFSDEEITTFLNFYAKVQEVVTVTFTPKRGSYPFAKPLDLESIFGSNATLAHEWIGGGKGEFYSIYRTVNDNQAHNKILRIKTTTAGNVRVESASSDTYTMGIERFKKIFDASVKVWAKEGGTSHTGLSERGYDIKVYRDYLAIGCQSFPRAEIERIGLELGFDFPAGTVVED